MNCDKNITEILQENYKKIKRRENERKKEKIRENKRYNHKFSINKNWIKKVNKVKSISNVKKHIIRKEN